MLALAAALAGCAHAPASRPSEGDRAPRTDAVLPQEAWRDFKLPGKPLTQYRWVTKDGRVACEAQAESSASMWRRAVLLAPAQLGEVSFAWWVDRLVPGADLSAQGRGDAPARMIFAFDGDRQKLSMRNQMVFELAEALGGEPMPYATLMYVWANDQPIESVIIHPHTDRIRKIVVEQGGAHVRQWRDYRRNLAEDFRRAFGEEPGNLVAVGFMTDADNMATSAHTWYADLAVQGLPPLMPASSRP